MNPHHYVFKFAHLFLLILRDHRRHYTVVIKIRFRITIVQGDADRVPSGADQILLDLFTGTLNRRNDGDDRGDTDDNAQHRKEGSHFVRPDSLYCQTQILKQVLPSFHTDLSSGCVSLCLQAGFTSCFF